MILGLSKNNKGDLLEKRDFKLLQQALVNGPGSKRNTLVRKKKEGKRLVVITIRKNTYEMHTSMGRKRKKHR